ncbi:MAG: hypothetical protein ABIL25_10415, partial [candidate division WOR-3 bacterium]
MLLFAYAMCSHAAVWTTSGYTGFVPEKPELENVSVSPDGIVTLAPRSVEKATLDESSVWAITEAPGRRVYVGTGNCGRVYLLQPGANPRVVFDADAGQVLCLTTDRQGNVYFVTSPGGIVYRMAPTGNPVQLCSTGEEYVFDILSGPSGELYCATGINGRLYHIPPSGKPEVVFVAAQAHLTALAWLVEGKELLVGTSPGGIVYRLQFQPGKARPEASVLYDTPKDEVRALAVAGSGLVAIAANPDEAGESAAGVFCVTTDGALRWNWTCPESTVFDLLYRSGHLLVATGTNGIIFELDSLGHAALLRKVPAQSVVCLEPGAEAVLCGTIGPCHVYALGQDFASEGYIIAGPHDCAGPARFGRLSVRSTVPAGTALLFDTRSGDAEEPDSTWTEWQETSEFVRSPSGRFVQWRARLYSNFPALTPRLQQIDLYYCIPNRPPLITKFDVTVVNLADARAGKADPVRSLSWELSDPDSDSLALEVLFSRDDYTGRWQTLAKDLAGTGYELDTRMLPDGWCRFKLVAS